MVNFQEVVKKLHDRGWSDERIAAKIGLVRTAVYHMRIGRTKEPRYNAGRKLVELEQRTRRRQGGVY